MARVLAASLASLIAAAAATPARAGDAPGFVALDNAIRAFKQASGCPTGTAVMMIKDDRILFEGYYGNADVQGGVPVTRDTVFYIASATKPFFALDVLLARRAGRVDTDASLQAMFPAIRFDESLHAEAISAQQLLTHAGGIDNPALDWATAYSGLDTAAPVPRLIAETRADAAAAAGTFRYSNLGYTIASAWLDRVERRPWQRQLAARVFAPLGMAHTAAYASAAGAWPRALPYSAATGACEAPLYLRKRDATMHAAGGMLSTAPDLAAFLREELAAARGARTRLPADVLRASQQRQVATDDRYLDFARDGYAWGWYTGPYKGRRMLHHFGAFAGFHAHLSFMPEAGLALVVLNNEDALSARLTSAIADVAYGTALGEAGIEGIADARFGRLARDAGELREAVAAQRAKIAARPWRLSLPRAAYAGDYRDPLLGTVQVRLGPDDALDLRWGALRATATGFDRADSARVEFVPGSGQVVDFEVHGGKVRALGFDGLRFRRTR